MFKAVVVVALAFSMIIAPEAGAQTATPSLASAKKAAPNEQEEPKPDCIAIAYVYEIFELDRGKQKMQIAMGGGACEPPGSGISFLTVEDTSDTQFLKNDYVDVEDCPVYKHRLDKLWLKRRSALSGLRHGDKVDADPFLVLSDSKHLFDLRTVHGRRAAAIWIRQTLNAVNTCWNSQREDKTRQVVDRLRTLLAQ